MTAANGFAIEPPIEPMLAKLAEVIPPGTGYLYEPKWDGFRAIVFRSGREVRGNYDLAVDDRAGRQPIEQRVVQLRKVAIERPQIAALDEQSTSQASGR